MIKTQTGHTIKRYRLDNDAAITSNHMRQWANTQGVHFEFTALCSPNKDGVAERDMRTNIEKLRSLMAGCDLPKKLWPLGLSTTVYLKNWFPSKAIGEGITPIQKLTNIVPDLSYLRVWGCTAYLCLPEESLVKSEKFYPISKKHSFVGFDSHLWLLWDGHKVIRSKNVIFDESRYFAPDLPSELPTSGITSNQSWADVLGIEDSSAETLHVLEKEKMKDVIDIPHLKNPPILPDSRSSYPSPAPSNDLLIPEGRPKRITKVPARYQGFALVSGGYA